MKKLLKGLLPGKAVESEPVRDKQKADLAELRQRLANAKEREEKLRGRLAQLQTDIEAASAKYLVAKSAEVGIGNRLLFVAGSVVLSRFARRRLVIDWRDGMFGPMDENSFWTYFEESDAIQIRNFAFLEEAAPEDFTMPEWSGHLHLSIQKFGEHLRQTDWKPEYETDKALPRSRWKYHGFYEDRLPQRIQVAYGAKSRLNLLKTEELARMYPGLDCEGVIREVLRTQLRPGPELRRRLGEFTRAQFAGVRVLGVHVRNTDKTPGESIEELCRSAAKQASAIGAECKVFLATDHEPTQEVFRAEFGERLILQPKWFDATAEALHYSRNASAEQKREVGMQALLDIYSLAACTDLFLQHNSTFSRIVGFLTDVPPAQVAWHSQEEEVLWEP